MLFSILVPSLHIINPLILAPRSELGFSLKAVHKLCKELYECLLPQSPLQDFSLSICSVLYGMPRLKMHIYFCNSVRDLISLARINPLVIICFSCLVELAGT